MLRKSKLSKNDCSFRKQHFCRSRVLKLSAIRVKMSTMAQTWCSREVAWAETIGYSHAQKSAWPARSCFGIALRASLFPDPGHRRDTPTC